MASIELNYIARVYLTPDDPYWASQSYLANIQAPLAWEITTGTPDVVVAVVDTGIDTVHVDLAAKIWNNPGEIGLDADGNDRRTNEVDDDGNGYVDDWQGWNTVADTGNVQDDSGHGSRVASVIAADTNNEEGIAGVAWGARIMPVKALNGAGFGTYTQVAEGIVYAVDHGARVINLSFGSSANSALLKAAVDYAEAQGVVVVAAAGNSGTAMDNYPAAYPNVIAVGATDSDDRIASFSTVGSAIDLVAPGVDVYAASPGDSYTQSSGTSMAAAHVSGVAALLASLPQNTAPAQIRDALFSTALDLGVPGQDSTYGFGLVQACTALAYSLAGGPIPTPVPTATVPLGPLPTPGGGGVWAFAPTPTAPAPAPTSVPSAGDPHTDNALTANSCASCHRSHTADGIVLRQMWPEENSCFDCHASGGPGTDVQSAFISYANTATRFFKHAVAATNGVHQVNQSTGADFGGANRHVECEDCHAPHDATRGASTAPMLQREMDQISGVEPAWSAAGAPDSLTWQWPAEREFQVCFKCHSSFTTLPTYAPDGWDGSSYVADGLRKLTSTDPNQVLDSWDLAQEFNPYNASYHPVIAQGQNQSIPAGGFVAGWSQTSLVYCTDCHSNANAATQGEGPHGSPLLHMLVGAPNNGGQQNYTTQGVGTANNTSDQALCFKCHDAATYLTEAAGTENNTNFQKGGTWNLHGYHMVWGATCYSCHDTHGSEQQHLINFELTTAPAGGLQPAAGRDSQTAWFTAGAQAGCALTCHGTLHDGDVNANFRYP